MTSFGRRSIGAAGLLLALMATGAAAEEERFALLVGIDAYNPESFGISPLQGSVKDIEAIRRALVTEGGFDPDNVVVLSSDRPGSRPTLDQIKRQLKLLEHLDSDDLVYVHFSLHAVLNADTGRTYLLPWDASSPRHDLDTRALPLDEVVERLSGLASPKRLLVLDGCRNDPEPGRGETDNVMWSDFFGAEDDEQLFEFVEAEEQVSFIQVLMACGEGQRAYEIPGTGRGLFSTALEEALSGRGEDEWGDGDVTLGELVSYVTRRVPRLAEEHLPPDVRQEPEAVLHLPQPLRGGPADEAALRRAALSFRLTQVDPLALRDLTPARVPEPGGGPELPPEAPLDYAPPTLAFAAQPPATVASKEATALALRFRTRVTGDDATLVWRLDDRPLREEQGDELVLRDLAPGMHTLWVYVRDGYDGVSDTLEATFTVLANRAPSVAYVEPAAGAAFEPGPVKVVLDGADSDGEVVRFELALDDKDRSQSSTDGTFTLRNGLDVGDHVLYARTIDDQGERSFWKELPFRVEEPQALPCELMAEGRIRLEAGSIEDAMATFRKARKAGDDADVRTLADSGTADALYEEYNRLVGRHGLNTKTMPSLEDAVDAYEDLLKRRPLRDCRDIQIQAFALYRLVKLNAFRTEYYVKKWNKYKRQSDKTLWGRYKQERDESLVQLKLEYGTEADEQGVVLWQRAESELGL